MTSSEGNSRDGETLVSHTDELPFLTALHVLFNADVVFDGIRGGTGDIGWTIAVIREDGSITRIQREDLVADGRDLTFDLLWGIFRDLGRIVNNPFEEVEVTDVDVTAQLETRLLQGRIAEVEARRGGEWITVDEDTRLTVRAGGTIPLRAHVRPTSDSDSAPDTVRVDAFVPDRGEATRGHVHLFGGGRGGGGNVGSFDELVENIENQPPSNSVGGYFHYTGRGGGGRSTIEPAETTSTVAGGFDFSVLVKR